jgi:hypothetical protein
VSYWRSSIISLTSLRRKVVELIGFVFESAMHVRRLSARGKNRFEPSRQLVTVKSMEIIACTDQLCINVFRTARRRITTRRKTNWSDLRSTARRMQRSTPTANKRTLDDLINFLNTVNFLNSDCWRARFLKLSVLFCLFFSPSLFSPSLFSPFLFSKESLFPFPFFPF